MQAVPLIDGKGKVEGKGLGKRSIPLDLPHDSVFELRIGAVDFTKPPPIKEQNPPILQVSQVCKLEVFASWLGDAKTREDGGKDARFRSKEVVRSETRPWTPRVFLLDDRVSDRQVTHYPARIYPNVIL